MSTRSRYREERDELPPPRSKCITCLCFSWKIFSCVFSHITLIALVVAYCVLGAVLFERLESENELLVRKKIPTIRENTTLEIWKNTMQMDYLKMENWTLSTIKFLESFESSILKAMKEDGWDGFEYGENEDPKSQWSFTGSLFYSIIVITTIGYGHIAPKTVIGKISTIFYAILGIPLMLLCLSNIGDIMASSFRFIYWRVCCYVCTRQPKKNQKKKQMIRRQQQQLLQQQQLALQERSGRYSGRFQTQSSMRRSIRTSQRSADSGIDPYYDAGIGHAYSEMDFRYSGANGASGCGNGEQQLYYDEREKMRGRSVNPPHYRQPPSRYDPRNDSRYARGDRHTVDRERFAKYQPDDDYGYDEDVEQQASHMSRRDRMRERDRRSSPPQERNMRHSEDRQMGAGGSPRHMKAGPSRVQSLDRRMMRRDPVLVEFEREQSCKAPMYCNKYAMDDVEERQPKRPNMRSQSMPRQSSRYGDRLLPPQLNGRENRGSGSGNSAAYEDNMDDMQPRKGRKPSRPVPSPSPRIMSPMGFAVNRQARHIASVMDENSLYGEDWDPYRGDGPPMSYIKPVPIWLCVFLVIGYIVGGAWLFKQWEGWSYLDSAYFCFITLTTIGFGDFVPAQGQKESPERSIAYCSLYLLFGIALLAMSFNLVQEEVIARVKSVAKRLGIIKEDEVED